MTGIAFDTAMAVYADGSGDLAAPDVWAPQPRAVRSHVSDDAALVAIPRQLKLIRENEPPCTIDPDAWFPVAGISDIAIRICERCPVATICLEYAMAHDLLGVWGGTYQVERRRRQRALGIKPTPVALVGD